MRKRAQVIFIYFLKTYLNVLETPKDTHSQSSGIALVRLSKQNTSQGGVGALKIDTPIWYDMGEIDTFDYLVAMAMEMRSKEVEDEVVVYF